MEGAKRIIEDQKSNATPFGLNVRPHPGPLPQERETASDPSANRSSRLHSPRAVICRITFMTHNSQCGGRPVAVTLLSTVLGYRPNPTIQPIESAVAAPLCRRSPRRPDPLRAPCSMPSL